jgi:hypothetical protein
MVNTLRSDPQTSEEEHFKLMLVQTEMERVKYLVRSYVRTRLHKVCLVFPPLRDTERGAYGRSRNTLHISLLPPNYIIYYQERNCNMPSGKSISTFHFPPHHTCTYPPSPCLLSSESIRQGIDR